MLYFNRSCCNDQYDVPLRQPSSSNAKMVKSKRNNDSVTNESENDTKKAFKTADIASPPTSDHVDYEDNGMGEFEDAFEDEMEEEEMEIAENSDSEFGKLSLLKIVSDKVEKMEEEPTEEAVHVAPRLQAFLPGQKMEDDEVLDFDHSAYKMYHAMNMEWPCLSFDIFQDNLGSKRTKFPMSMLMVAGTQADNADSNKLIVMKMSRLSQMKNSENSDDDESDDENVDEDPIVETRYIDHNGGINRVRVMPHADVNFTATWSDTGKVHIWDLTETVKSLSSPGIQAKSKLQPVHTVTTHSTEGYAMDWSSRTPGRLLTGDCSGDIYLTERTATGWTTDPTAFKGHTDSVEDLQWSPYSDTVFASCSVDQTIKIWDTRMKKKCGYSLHAHSCDINVISWSRTVSHLLASGADDGSFSVWDLRQFKGTEKPQPAASFQWHKDQLTSIEWHPTEPSMLAVSGADDQVTLWDFSVEQDVEEMSDQDAPEVPPQLMFIHQGQQCIKELHWHSQMPGVLLSTAMTGLNIFKTINSE